MTPFVHAPGALAVLDPPSPHERPREELLALLEVAGEGILLAEPDGTILLANREAERMWGYSREDLLGRNTALLLPGCRSDVPPGCLTHGFAGMFPVQGHWFELEGSRRDGTTFPLEVRISKVQLTDRRLYAIGMRDISDRRQAEAALRQAEMKYRSIFEHASEGIFQTTLDGQYLTANPALAALYGYDSPEELIASRTDISGQLYVDPSRRAVFQRMVETQEMVVGFESQVYRRDGSVIWISENAWTVWDDETGFLYYEGSVVDITRRKQYEATIEWQARHDALTGLPNRACFQDRLEAAVFEAERQGHMGAVLFLDLDNFKQINDTLGHEAGDRLLQEVGHRLQTRLRAGETLARMGGDEFTVLLPRIPTPAEALLVAEGLLERLSAPVRMDDATELYAQASVGVCLFPDHGRDVATLLKHADIAMYRSKRDGRDRASLFTEEMNTTDYDRMMLGADLRRVIEDGNLVVHYQPQTDMPTGRMTGVEALARWPHPERGWVPPSVFIPLAEEMGLIGILGAFVLEEACRQAVRWQEHGRFLRVSVNLSAHQLRQSDLIERVAAVLRETGLSPSWLTVELTESALLENGLEAVRLLEELRALGVHVALDDFGTGYSSLSYLRCLPLDGLKIDRSFIGALTQESKGQAVVQAIIDLAQALGLAVTAEGVETTAQQDYLRTLGCDSLQGYLFSPAVSPEEIERLA